MSELRFHHFFVFGPRGAPAVDRLVSQGFREGSRNAHPGQGTANRRVFFENGMLEFIWIENAAEAKSPATLRTRLYERSASAKSGFSPFGVALCSVDAALPARPFAGWDYRPGYLPPGISIWSADGAAHPWEPMIFALGGVAPYGPEIARREPIDHPCGARRIDKISITMASVAGAAPPSDAALCLGDIAQPSIELLRGAAPRADIVIAGLAEQLSF